MAQTAHVITELTKKGIPNKISDPEEPSGMPISGETQESKSDEFITEHNFMLQSAIQDMKKQPDVK